MTLTGFDAAAAVVLSWLATYAIHSTILLGLAALAAWRFAEHHPWLDLIWKTAVIAPLVTASLNIDAISIPVGARWSVQGTPVVTPQPEPVGAAVVETAAAMDSDTPTPRFRESNATPHPVRRRPVAFASWPLIAAVTWLSVGLAFALRYAVRLRRVYRALESGAPVTNADLIDAVRNADRRRTIQLSTNPMCPVPLALAGRHIVLPERFHQDLEPEQQQAALAHEIAHIVRRDPEWRIGMEVLERVLFFQPLNRVARVRLCDAAEFLCDEWAVNHVQSPLAMARCLSVVASWSTQTAPGRRSLGDGGLPAGVSAMARSDSAMVRRVTRILSEPAGAGWRPRLHWLAIPVALVAIAAPRVTATQVPVAAVTSMAAIIDAAAGEKDEKTDPTEETQRDHQRRWTAAEVAAVRGQLRVTRFEAGGSLDVRWRQALADAGRQGLNDFWIVYTFNTPAHADGLTINDSDGDGLNISSNGWINTDGPPITSLFFANSAVPLEGGTIAVLMHYRGARAEALDRGGYRTASLGFNFGRTPVFWLGAAPEGESFARVESLFNQARIEKIQTMLIELASTHAIADRVIPFLTRLVDPSAWSPAIRAEAAEGFDHQHDPRSIDVLLRVARTDPDRRVRAEAAETIGDVQVPQAIDALNTLIRESDDPQVRHEAAEGFGQQPAGRAIPAIQSAIASNQDEEVLAELVEALGDIDDASVLGLLEATALQHRSRRARQEAVETIGDLHEHPGAMAALERILAESQDEEVQAEVVETMGDLMGETIAPQVLTLAESGRTPRIRREAIETLSDAFDKVDSRTLDTAEQVLERIVFNDADRSVRMEALDALDELPRDRAIRALRRVADTHPDPRIRREAEDQLRDK